jgi:hypothetical protein
MKEIVFKYPPFVKQLGFDEDQIIKVEETDEEIDDKLDFSIEVKEYELPHSPIMRWAKGIGGVK